MKNFSHYFIYLHFIFTEKRNNIIILNKTNLLIVNFSTKTRKTTDMALCEVQTQKNQFATDKYNIYGTSNDVKKKNL